MMTTTKKRIMRAFRVDEISVVDRPANAHARMTVMKRADDPDEENDMHNVASFDDLGSAIAAIEKREGCGRLSAMEKAARQHPDLLQKYQTEGQQRAEKALQRMPSPRPAPALLAFRRIVDEIARRDNISPLEAMTRARAEFPEEFLAMQDS